MTEKPTIDRPLKDIIRSVQLLISDGKVRGQMARDFEKLCVAATAHPSHDRGE